MDFLKVGEEKELSDTLVTPEQENAMNTEIERRRKAMSRGLQLRDIVDTGGFKELMALLEEVEEKTWDDLKKVTVNDFAQLGELAQTARLTSAIIKRLRNEIRGAINKTKSPESTGE